MIKNLTKTIQEDEITKLMARLIIKRLRKKGVPIDLELAEIVGS